MKIFNKKSDKFKVGRPRLADNIVKKNALIFSLSCIVLILFLLAGSLISLNILPKFGKMKGAVVCTIDQIPEDLRPGGLHEYGFDDPNFYSVVVSRISNNTSCTVTPEQLATITNLYASYASNKGIKSVNGIQYLTGLTQFDLSENQLTSIDLSQNTALNNMRLSYNQLTNIIFPSSTQNFGDFSLDYNNLSGTLDLSNIHFRSGYPVLDVSHNNLDEVILPSNASFDHIDVSYNNLTSIEFNNITSPGLDLNNNKLTEIKGIENVIGLSRVYVQNNNLTSIIISNFGRDSFNYIDKRLSFYNNPMSNTKYLLKGDEIDYNPVTLNDNFTIATEISDESIISLSNNKLKGLKEGSSIIKMSNENIKSQNPVYAKIDETFNECLSIYSVETDAVNCTLDKLGMTMEEIQEVASNEYLDYFFSQEIKVYDITSDKYSIDKESKTISYTGEFDKDKITLTLDGLTGEVDQDKYIVKDGDVIADTFTLVNVGSSTTNNLTSSNKVDKKVTTTTTKKVETTKKNSSKKVTTTTETKKEETTTTEKVVVNKIVENKTTTKSEDKENKIPVVPIAVGGTVAIAGLGYGIYLLKIKP